MKKKKEPRPQYKKDKVISLRMDSHLYEAYLTYKAHMEILFPKSKWQLRKIIHDHLENLLIDEGFLK